MDIAVAALLGVLTWSFLEYIIHRWLGHHPRLKRSRRNPFGVEHTAHHSRGDTFAPWWKKAIAATAATGMLAPPAVLLAGPGAGGVFVASFVGFYLCYEVLHRLMHTWQGVGSYGRWARRHHFYHHFHDPRMNHGVTSPVWDVVFGTRVRVDRVEVPERLAMRWLRDDVGEVRPELRDTYGLRAAKRAFHGHATAA